MRRLRRSPMKAETGGWAVTVGHPRHLQAGCAIRCVQALSRMARLQQGWANDSGWREQRRVEQPPKMSPPFGFFVQACGCFDFYSLFAAIARCLRPLPIRSSPRRQ